MTLMIIEINH